MLAFAMIKLIVFLPFQNKYLPIFCNPQAKPHGLIGTQICCFLNFACKQ